MSNFDVRERVAATLHFTTESDSLVLLAVSSNSEHDASWFQPVESDNTKSGKSFRSVPRVPHLSLKTSIGTCEITDHLCPDMSSDIVPSATP